MIILTWLQLILLLPVKDQGIKSLENMNEKALVQMLNLAQNFHTSIMYSKLSQICVITELGSY
jgi:ribosomal protein L30E